MLLEKFYLVMKILSQVNRCVVDMILSNHNEIPRILKSSFKNDFDQNVFYLSTDFQNVFCTSCDKLSAQLYQENISSKFKHLQNVCGKKHNLTLGNTL